MASRRNRVITFKVHPTQIQKWKKQALEQLPDLFADGRGHKVEDNTAQLYEKIGRFEVELGWLKKNQRSSADAMRQLIDPKYSLRHCS
jgi:hypothetical protein